MKRLALLFAIYFAVSVNAHAQPADVIGGADSNIQTISHCGYLPTSAPTYTNTPLLVRIVQQKLTKLGYYHGAIDGLYGPASKQAVRNFQLDVNLPVDGNVGPQTAQKLAYRAHNAANVSRCDRLAQHSFR